MKRFLLIELEQAREACAAARAARDAGHPPCDILSSHPIEGIEEFLAPRPTSKPVGWVMVGAGLIGAAVGYVMQWFSAVIDYPIDSGGRPLNSWPAFLLVPYETTILAATIVGILTWMAMCGLPKLYHLLFAAPVVERATQDRYLLVIPHDPESARWASSCFDVGHIHEVQE